MSNLVVSTLRRSPIAILFGFPVLCLALWGCGDSGETVFGTLATPVATESVPDPTATQVAEPAEAAEVAAPVVSADTEPPSGTADPESADPESADPESADPESADPESADPESADPESAAPESESAGAADSAEPVLDEFPVIDEQTFKALGDMTPVRGFFVDNLIGDLEGTLAAAWAPNGAMYPTGSVVQLIPGEVMIKREPGFSPETNDWEFFELDVAATGSTIRVRGGVEVVNRFGLSCVECHKLAEPQFDFVCEQDHGCDPLPFSRDVIETIQNDDPRPLLGA